ncbi:MAG: flippase-like domain-containing protein [Deltaproteobacteria bacterium]|nr:flippase-like domain-containing protein [Deltaproteobacteria bacterium]
MTDRSEASSSVTASARTEDIGPNADRGDRPPPAPRPARWKSILKIVVSVGLTALILRKVFQDQSLAELQAKVGNIQWWLVGLAFLAQCTASTFSIVRWQRLLVGQGLHVPWRHLIGTFLVGRFIGSFTPSTTGLDGYRMYDIARHSGRTARSVSTIAAEKITGFFALSVILIVAAPFGVKFVGAHAVGVLALAFSVPLTLSLAILARPGFIRTLAKRLPGGVQRKLASTTDAITAYQGKGKLLAQACGTGLGTHASTVLIFYCTAHAMGIPLGATDALFVAVLIIVSAIMPLSIAGIGVREGVAIALLAKIGVDAGDATLMAFLGYLVGEALSLFGGLVMLARPAGYAPTITGPAMAETEAERAREIEEATTHPPITDAELPGRIRALSLGAGAGLLAGVVLGLGEASAITAAATGAHGIQPGVFLYAAVAYGLACTGIGAAGGLAYALLWRRWRLRAMQDGLLWARLAMGMICAFGFVLVRFRVHRDVFHEDLKWMSAKGLLIQLGLAAAFALAFWLGSRILSFLVARRPLSVLLRGWGSPALGLAVVAAVAAVALRNGEAIGDTAGHRAARAPAGAPNVLLIMVDTVRADHLPPYGYTKGRTPNLDAFARESVRFDQAFAQASWTRPSVASILTGRMPASHRTMFKGDALPTEIDTLAESLQRGGYATAGLVTNYNIAPFFRFDQGFDEYRYLEPDLVLWAGDTEAKLALVSAGRVVIERARAALGRTSHSTYYRDAPEVNSEVTRWLDRAPDAPWFLFVSYMDPHDPYFEHPYDGRAIARVSTPNPSPAQADEMRRLYDGEITYWDHHFGQLIADLRRRGLYDDTLIIVTSDHGEEFHDHGGFWHGTTLYDEQLRVPLFVHLPGGELGGSVVSDWVRSIDIAPTVLRFAQVAPPRGTQGEDLFREGGAREVLAEEDHEGNRLASLRVRGREGEGDRKIIVANPGNPRGLPEREHFRVDIDPGERRDLAERDADHTRRLGSSLVQSVERASQGAARQSGVALDESSADRLRALGYGH